MLQVDLVVGQTRLLDERCGPRGTRPVWCRRGPGDYSLVTPASPRPPRGGCCNSRSVGERPRTPGALCPALREFRRSCRFAGDGFEELRPRSGRPIPSFTPPASDIGPGISLWSDRILPCLLAARSPERHPP